MCIIILLNNKCNINVYSILIIDIYISEKWLFCKLYVNWKCILSPSTKMSLVYIIFASFRTICFFTLLMLRYESQFRPPQNSAHVVARELL